MNDVVFVSPALAREAEVCKILFVHVLTSTPVIFSLPDSRRAVVSFWRKNVHITG